MIKLMNIDHYCVVFINLFYYCHIFHISPTTNLHIVNITYVVSRTHYPVLLYKLCRHNNPPSQSNLADSLLLVGIQKISFCGINLMYHIRVLCKAARGSRWPDLHKLD